MRQNEQDKVFVVLNFSDMPQTVTFVESLYHGCYTEYFSNESVELTGATELKLSPWGYLVFVK